MKVVVKGKFIALKAYIRKEERSKINHRSFHHRKAAKKKSKLNPKQKKRNNKN